MKRNCFPIKSKKLSTRLQVKGIMFLICFTSFMLSCFSVHGVDDESHRNLLLSPETVLEDLMQKTESLRKERESLRRTMDRLNQHRSDRLKQERNMTLSAELKMQANWSTVTYPSTIGHRDNGNCVVIRFCVKVKDYSYAVFWD